MNSDHFKVNIDQNYLMGKFVHVHVIQYHVHVHVHIVHVHVRCRNYMCMDIC